MNVLRKRVCCSLFIELRVAIFHFMSRFNQKEKFKFNISQLMHINGISYNVICKNQYYIVGNKGGLSSIFINISDHMHLFVGTYHTYIWQCNLIQIIIIIDEFQRLNFSYLSNQPILVIIQAHMRCILIYFYI